MSNSRGLSSTVETAVVAPVVRLAFFGEFQFASGTVRMWSGIGSKSWNGNTWDGFGSMLGFSPVDETTEFGAAGLTFTWSGIPSTAISLALTDNYRGRLCRLWLAVLDESFAVLDTYQIFAGRMDFMTIDDSGDTSTISLQVESRLIDLGRARASRYTDAEQQLRYPGDKGLEFVAKLAERPLNWGVPYPTPSYSPGYSGGGGMISVLH